MHRVQPSDQPLSMHARLLRPGFWGNVVGLGTNGYLRVEGLGVSWSEGGLHAPAQWQVDASEIIIARQPMATNPDLLLSVRGEVLRYLVDLAPLSIFTKGLLINARRGVAARAMAAAIVAAQSRA